MHSSHMPPKIVPTSAVLPLNITLEKKPLHEQHQMLSQVIPPAEVLPTNITLDQTPFIYSATCSPRYSLLLKFFPQTSHLSRSLFMNSTTCFPSHSPHLESSLQSSQWVHLFLFSRTTFIFMTNIIIVLPILSSSGAWEDKPLTQSFWTKFCPPLSLRH